MTAPDSLIEALAGRYRLERELGAGGMATVYLAEDMKHHRQVAVKVLREDLTASLGKDRFLREITIAAGLTHPHILPLHDSGEAAGRLFYVMPYVDGPSLRQRLLRAGELPIAEAVRVLRDIADAMGHAHRRGVVHRDLKPENVMLTERHALVTDFGVAKAVSEATGRQTLTTAGVALGTPTYMSPEQATADPHADHRSDIYSFGVLAYELLAGRPPFSGGSPQEVLAAHVTTAAVPVTQYRGSIPPALATLIMRCLEKKPADRWQSAEELIPLLETLLTPSGGITLHETAPYAGAGAGSRSRGPGVRGLRVAIGVVIVVALAAGGYAAWQRFTSAATTSGAERVAVMRFENRTGIDSLGTFGLMVSDLITNELARSGVVDVVPTASVMAIQGAELAGLNSSDPRVVARETRAGLVVAGNYFRQGDSLAIQAQVIDAARNSPAMPLQQVTVALANEREGLAKVRDQVLVALSARVNPSLGGSATRMELPQSLDAYREFVTGLELHLFADKPAEALPHYYRAHELDSSSALILLQIALVEWNANTALGRTDSLLRLLEPRRAQLLPSDARRHEYLRTWVDGDIEGQWRASVAWLADDSTWIGGFVQEAFRSNRWDEARKRVRAAKAQAISRRAPRFWSFATNVAHYFGAHEEELAEARQGLKEAGESRLTLVNELRALAALGRHDELRSRLDLLRATSPRDGYFRTSASELRRHGHHAAADDIGRLAVQWYRAELAKAPTPALRRQLGGALFDLGQTDSARLIYEGLARDDSTDVAALGYLGVLAARRGEAATADAFIARLGAISTPYIFGSHVGWQGRISAQLGQCERAVGFLAQATRRGRSYNSNWEDDLLDPIADCPAFKRFMAPRE